MFLVLQAALGSWRMALLILASLPLACAGGVLTAFLVGGVTNAGAAIGLFAALGVGVREILLLMRRYQGLEAVEGSSHRMDVVIRATRSCAGPFAVTAATTIAALAPVLVTGSQAGTELLYPMAIVLAGGVVSVTLFALLVAPNLYLSFAPVVNGDLVFIRPVNGSTPIAQVEVVAPLPLAAATPVHASD
jgi:multidrug efflux pump subunit AcrB